MANKKKTKEEAKEEEVIEEEESPVVEVAEGSAPASSVNASSNAYE